MPKLKAVLRQLQSQRDDLERNIKRLDSAIDTLSSLDGTGRGRRGGSRHISSAGRKHIAMAQKKRWAKWKAKKKESVLKFLILFLLFGAVGASAQQSASFVHGTIIAIERDTDRFIVMADSRTTNDSANEHTDDACKITQLNNDTLFVATGKTGATINGKKAFDAHDVARQVFGDISTPKNTDTRLAAVAWYTAVSLKNLYQDMTAQRPLVGVSPENNNLLLGFIVGDTSDYGLSAYQISINVIDKIENSPVPLIAPTAKKWQEDEGTASVFGVNPEKQGFREFWDNKTERARLANRRFENEVATTEHPDIQVMKLKAGIQAAIDWAARKDVIGGPLDVLELRHGTGIHWIEHKPECRLTAAKS